MAFLLATHLQPSADSPELLECCPRCGAEFDGEECNLREVNLLVLSGGWEWDETGYECARCGWCTEASPHPIN